MKNSNALKVPMLTTRACAAALAGLLLVAPSLAWSQAAERARGSTDVVAAARYGEARELERRGYWAAAMQAYHEAAASGHGPAQKRLGDIYGNGKGEVERDYETSLRWYQRAREQGEDIPLPFSYPGVRR
jgi:serine/threonine-protein kinase